MSYPPPYPGQPPVPPVPGAPMADKAAWSLGLGLVSLCAFGPLTGVPAIVLGVQARRQIRESQGSLSGDGIALGGMISGVIGSLLWLVLGALIAMLVVFGVQASNQYDKACEEYFSDSGSEIRCDFG